MLVHVPNSGDLSTALAAESKKASALGLAPYLEFSATWCGPCNAFKSHLDDPRMQQALEGTYIVVADFDHFGDDAEAMDVRAIPAWLALDADGKPTGRRIDGGAWKEDVPENMAPPLGAFFHAK